MKTTIRNRAVALTIATAAGLTGLGLAAGPAMAADSGAADSSSRSAASDVDAQSVYYPTDPTRYADELVRAWGKGDTKRVQAFASPEVAKTLAYHIPDDNTHWDRTGGEGAAGTTYIEYTNTVTGETMTLGLPTEAVTNPDSEWGEPNAVHKIKFDN